MRIVWLGLVIVVAGVGCGDVNLKDYCASPLTRCGDTCVDLQGDPDNCGACGSACGAGQACSSGTCECTGTGAMYCGGACVDSMTDTANCGTCGNACGDGQSCMAGTCGATCNAPLTACPDATGGYCADLASDDANCGMCGSACGQGNRCFSSACTPNPWVTLAQAPATVPAPGASDFTPPMMRGFYLLQGSSLVFYDPMTNVYTTLAAPPVAVSPWNGPAWIGTDLYSIAEGDVMKYDITANAWTVLLTGVHSNTESETTHDQNGHLYTFTDAAEVAIYDIASNTIAYVATTGLDAPSEPHLNFDDASDKLYISSSFFSANLYAFDPVAQTTTMLTPNPETQMNDAFCADHKGHIIAAGSTSGTTVLSYDIASNTWSNLPNLPFDQGNCGACTVDDNGNLYFVAGNCGNASNVATIQLH